MTQRKSSSLCSLQSGTDTERQHINRKVPSLLAYFREEFAFCSQHPHMPLNGKFSVSLGLCIMVVNST